LPKKNYIPFRTRYTKQVEEVDKILKASGRGQISFPDVKKLASEIHDFLYSSYPSSIFQSDKRHPIVTRVALCPPHLKSELGSRLPTHIVTPNNLVLDKETPNCSSCNETFDIFRWQSNCMVCGTSNCNDCLVNRIVPDYQKPVQVCSCCMPTVKNTY